MAKSDSAQPRRRSLSERISQHDVLFDTPEEMRGVKFFYPRLVEIRPNSANARVLFAPEPLQELADSIRQYGVIQPITVHLVPDEGEVRYEIIAGERRYRASLLAGKTHIPALLVADGQNAALALVENLQRENLNPLEEALGIQHIIERERLSQSAAAERIGRSRTAVSKTLGLLALDETIKREVLEGADVSRSVLLELITLPSAEQRVLWPRIISGATVRDLRESKGRKPPAPASTFGFVQEASRKIARLPGRLASRPPEEKRQFAAELEKLRDAISDVLKELS